MGRAIRPVGANRIVALGHAVAVAQQDRERRLVAAHPHRKVDKTSGRSGKKMMRRKPSASHWVHSIPFDA